MTFAHLLGDVYAAFAIGALSVYLSSQFGGEQIGLVLIMATPGCPSRRWRCRHVGKPLLQRDVEALGATVEATLGTGAVR